MSKPTLTKTLPKPHKKPSQARSRFTVQVLYETFVRIWRRDGPTATSMRAIAAESGYAIGTIYGYFPNLEALLSGYFRYCMERLVGELEQVDTPQPPPAQATQPAARPAAQPTSNQPPGPAPWPQYLRRLVAILLDEAHQAPYFDADMLLWESRIADSSEHGKAFQRLSTAWRALLARWPDAPAIDQNTADRMLLHLWGARRYALLLNYDLSAAPAVDDMTSALLAIARSAACRSATSK